MLTSASASKMEAINRSVAEAEQKAETFTRMGETRKHIEELESQAEANALDAERLTTALDVELPELRTALLDKVPVKGVTVRDGDIFVDDPDGQAIPFDSVNTKEKIRVACDLALLKAGPVPLLLMDGAEALDEESLNELRDALEARGAQCIATRVTEDETITITRQ